MNRLLLNAKHGTGEILPDETNGLSKVSAVDVLQLRGIDTQRFAQRLGHVSPTIMQIIVSAIAAVIEYGD